jgi:beta-fructofuranosidase
MKKGIVSAVVLLAWAAAMSADLLTTTTNFITGVSIAGVSSENANRLAVNIINGNGLGSPVQTTGHSISLGGHVWETVAPDKHPTITFDLGRSYHLEQLRVWNHNGGPDNSNRGLESVDVYVSPARDPAHFVFAETVTVPKAPGTPGYQGEIVKLSDLPVYQNVRLIKLDAKSNYGGTISGLSEIRFIAVPPPAPADFQQSRSDALNFHLMHPGGPSAPADPNAGFHLNGTYHLHYILRHPWQERERAYSYVHVTSTNMLDWVWQPTKLQPSFTGHDMFSGTGFMTTDGKPTIIYHGFEPVKQNFIAVAKNNDLSEWEKPYPVEVRMKDGSEATFRQWDPDCFLVGDTYYAISGGVNPPLFKSADLINWVYVDDFIKHDLSGVVIGEDISCANFFPIGGKWMLLCISHPLGAQYYVGDWDAAAEQFVPQTHGRLTGAPRTKLAGNPIRDVFAPETILTKDGRRVMWAWLLVQGIHNKSVQSLPRELSLAGDGTLRMKPVRELETLRQDHVHSGSAIRLNGSYNGRFLMEQVKIADLPGDSVELRIKVAREQVRRKIFGITLFVDEKGDGLEVVLRPDKGVLQVGDREAPFSVDDLAPGEELEIRVFIDKYLVEVFAGDRVSIPYIFEGDRPNRRGVYAWAYGAPMVIDQFDIWTLRPTNRGFLDAQTNPVWKPLEK